MRVAIVTPEYWPHGLIEVRNHWGGTLSLHHWYGRVRQATAQVAAVGPGSGVCVS